MTRISLDRSFAEQAYTRMYSSDFFFPSNCKLTKIVNAGSIDASLRRAGLLSDKLFVVEKVPSPLSRKAARVFARLFMAVAINGFIAPIGALVHGVLTIKHLAAYALNRQAQDWQKAKAHGYDFLNDFTVSLWSVVFVVRFPSLAAEAGIATAIGVCVFGGMFFNLFYAFPQFLSVMLMYRSDRDCYLKSLKLRNEYGIVDQTGQMLPWTSQDKEIFTERIGSIAYLYDKKWTALLTEIYNVQDQLEKKELPLMQASYPINIQSVVDHVNLHLNDGVLGDKFVEYDRQLHMLRDFLSECLVFASAFYILGIDADAKWPLPSQECCDRVFSRDVPQTDANTNENTFQNCIRDAKDAVRGKAFSEDSESKRLQQLLLGNEPITPEKILKLGNHPTLEIAKKNYRTISLQVHPDKCKLSELFTLVSAAYQMMDKKFSQAPSGILGRLRQAAGL